MLSFQGWGQVTSISLSQSTMCFGDATTRLVINSNSDTWIFVERYDYSTSQWVLSNNPRQKVFNGIPLNFKFERWEGLKTIKKRVALKNYHQGRCKLR